MQQSNYIIEVKGVSKFFGDKMVLDNINLYVKKGEFVTVLGPSGCGKTTLLRLIAGFQTASEGEIKIAGKEITQTPPHKRPVNTVFQKYALFPHLNVFDNIAFGLKLKKISKQTIEKKVKAALRMVGMTDYEYRDVNSLSGGQQQRVAIARAIVNEPEVLLLDEPLAALDLKMRKDMQMELKEMHKTLGITFIYVTHDQEEALTLSDTIVVMSEGKIQQIGTPVDIYNEPINSFVADFIGESNILNGTCIIIICKCFLSCLYSLVCIIRLIKILRKLDSIITCSLSLIIREINNIRLLIICIEFQIAITLHTSTYWKQLTDDNIFLHTKQRVNLAIDSCIGQSLCSLLEGCC